MGLQLGPQTHAVLAHRQSLHDIHTSTMRNWMGASAMQDHSWLMADVNMQHGKHLLWLPDTGRLRDLCDT